MPPAATIITADPGTGAGASSRCTASTAIHTTSASIAMRVDERGQDFGARVTVGRAARRRTLRQRALAKSATTNDAASVTMWPGVGDERERSGNACRPRASTPAKPAGEDERRPQRARGRGRARPRRRGRAVPEPHGSRWPTLGSAHSVAIGGPDQRRHSRRSRRFRQSAARGDCGDRALTSAGSDARRRGSPRSFPDAT